MHNRYALCRDGSTAFGDRDNTLFLLAFSFYRNRDWLGDQDYSVNHKRVERLMGLMVRK